MGRCWRTGRRRLLHPSAFDFGTTALDPEEIAGQTVIEAGAYDVNGSVRAAIEACGPAKYIGTDMRPGPGVDVVCAAEDLPGMFGYNTAGAVVTMEMLEHARDWQAAVAGLIHVLIPGGPLVITTRSEGAGYHAHPGDFWRFSVPAMTGMLQAAGLRVERCEPDPEHAGVFAKARKPRNWMWHGHAPGVDGCRWCHPHAATTLGGLVRTRLNPAWITYMEEIGGVAGPYYWPWQFHVAPNGGGADDTVNLNMAVQNAVAYAQANQGYAEVICDPALYTLSGATTKTSTNKGNAQVWLPVCADAAQKVTLVIRSTRCSSALPFYSVGGSPQLGGCVWLCTLTGQAIDGTYGAPSILGGPTPQGLSGFSNMNIVIDGISIVAPLNPTVIAMDFRDLAQMAIISASTLVDAPVTTLYGGSAPTNSWSTGLYTPLVSNNDLVHVNDLSIQGYYYGVIAAEHLEWQRIYAAYCVVGMALVTEGLAHGWSGLYYSAEENITHLQAINGGTFPPPTPLFLAHLDSEEVSYFGTSGHHVDDSGGILGGYIGLTNIGAYGGTASVSVNGAANLEIISLNQPRGWVTPPAVPASGTPLNNPFWRHANVYINGTMTSPVQINGVSTGLPDTGTGLYRVPSGATITLTYSSAPSWTWELD